MSHVVFSFVLTSYTERGKRGSRELISSQSLWSEDLRAHACPLSFLFRGTYSWLLCCVQSPLTLGNPMGCSPPSCSVHGILQAGILEWVAVSYSNLLLVSHKYLKLWKKIYQLGFPGGSDSKESACDAGDPGLIPGLGRSPGEGNGNPLQYPCLENAMDRGDWRAVVHGVTKSWTRLSN